MNFSFPLKDVSIEVVNFKPVIQEPLYTDGMMQVSQNQFMLEIEDVAVFAVSNGETISIYPFKNSTLELINLYLNLQVLVAILYQRDIIAFHSSSFVWKGKGIMILGESGAGKSSLTASFNISGHDFLSDDITPIIKKSDELVIWDLPNIMRLRSDTLKQLDLDTEMLEKWNYGDGKYLFSSNEGSLEKSPLGYIFKLEVQDVEKLSFSEPANAEKFTILRSEICSWDILKGMPETEASFLHFLLSIIEGVKIVKVIRPVNFPIVKLHTALEQFLGLTTNK